MVTNMVSGFRKLEFIEDCDTLTCGHSYQFSNIEVYQFGKVTVMGLGQKIFMISSMNIPQYLDTVVRVDPTLSKVANACNTINEAASFLMAYCNCEFVKIASEFDYKQKLRNVCEQIAIFTLTKKPVCSVGEFANAADVSKDVMQHVLDCSAEIQAVPVGSRMRVYMLDER